ncbi:Ig-like domain-containing protein [Pseudomonas bananamidigenes]|uniref:Plug domain-containing protein n=1 Tax=Pseudomonas bananamidigenes TaxID=2843610 RepID=UPI00080379D8|nr:Plug domain-containing protein [Pseudomonas bananamidigenes]
MNLQSQAVSDALALFPVYPPQWVTPVQPPSMAHGGIPLSAFTPQGLEIVIEPITGLRNWVMAAFDVVTLFVNGVRTNVSKTIMPGEEGDRFLLHLPELWFINGVNDVFYRVTRVSGNQDDSPALQLLYHKPAPTISVGHPSSIGPGQPAIITLTVGYARPYDTVILTIGIWSITFTNPDPAKPITYSLTAAELQQIGDGTHPVNARVTDQLTNSNLSPTTTITIDTKQVVETRITSLTDASGASVPNGGSTFQTGVTLRGTTAPNQALQILLNGTVRQNITADVSGDWSYGISGLAVFFHTFIARPLPAGAPDSAPWRVNIVSEWKDDYTDFQNGSYNGWLLHNAARSGYIRVHAGVRAFFNFTDQGPISGFAGTVMYKDFDCPPGTYTFRMQACHVADSPAPGIPNPILQLQCGIAGGDGAVREVPKNGIWYDFLLSINVPARRIVRFYIQNHQNNGYGNDFGIRNISVIRSSGGGGGIMESLDEAPLYSGPPLQALPLI